MCWFAAYLAANPNATNAAAIRNEIDALGVKNQGTIERLLGLLKEMSRKLPDDTRCCTPNPDTYRLDAQRRIAALYLCAGDEDEAARMAKSHAKAYEESWFRRGDRSEGISEHAKAEDYQTFVIDLTNLGNLPAARSWQNKLAQLKPDWAANADNALSQAAKRITEESEEWNKKSAEDRVKRWTGELEDDYSGLIKLAGMNTPLFKDVGGFIKLLSEGVDRPSPVSTMIFGNDVDTSPKGALKAFDAVLGAVDSIVSRQWKIESRIREQGAAPASTPTPASR
jgi:hypothetical protein